MHFLRLFIVVLIVYQIVYCLHVFYDQSYRLLSLHQVSLLYTFWFLRWLNVLPEAIYCCFTRTILFTTMFTVLLWCVH